MLFSKAHAYMIDSENVGSTWIDLLQSEEKIDFYIFVTENAKSLNYTLLKQLTQNPRHKINIIECEPGKNSLDFYLSSYVGYLIGKGKHLSYTVVSQDTGYDHVIDYWNREGIDVRRINTKNDPDKKKARRNQQKQSRPAPFKPSPAKAAPAKPPVDSETRVIIKKQPDEIRQKTQEVQRQTEQAKKQVQEAKKQQPEQVKKPIEELKKQAEPEKKQQTEEPAKKQTEQAKKIQPEAAKKQAEEPKKKRTETKKKKAEEGKKQQPEAVKKETQEPKKEPEPEKKQQVEEIGKHSEEAKETPAKPKARKKRTKTSETKQDDSAKLMMKELLKDFPEEDQEDVCRYLNKVPAEKRSDKNYIYRGLVRKFKSEKGLAIYSLIKKDLDRYYNPSNENKQ